MLKSEHFKFYCLAIFATKTEINQHSMNTRGFCLFVSDQHDQHFN